MNVLKKIFGLFFLVFLVSCQSSDSAHITTDEVVAVLQDYQVELLDTNIPRGNPFGTKLNGVKPSEYELSGKPFYIYEFETEEDLKKGKSDFREKTAEMKLVSFIRIEKRNILIFYVHGIDSGEIPFEKEIGEALASIIEG